MADNEMEVDVTDEEYLILQARCCRETDPFAAKAWLVTAKTLFPKNFHIQYEVYTNEKNSKNVRESARYLEDLFRNFKFESGLWKELQLITDALQSESLDSNSCFLRDVFAMLPGDVQHEMLLSAADRSEDTQEHCKLLLLLLKKFPDKVVLHGMKLVDKLLIAEKHGQMKSPVNCFRKLLVYDILPLIFKSSSVDFHVKQVYKLLNKCIEFYVISIMQPQRLTRNQPAVLGLPENEMAIGNPWDQLGTILNSIGQKLKWELKDLFISSSKEHQWQRIQTFHQNLPCGSDDISHKQLFFCTLVLFLQCLYEYTSKSDPEQFATSTGNATLPSLILIDGFRAANEISEPKLKKRKLEMEGRDDILPTFHISKVIQGSSSVITHNFIIATRCWDLFHALDSMEKDFIRMQQKLQMDKWPWFLNFQLDRLIYQGQYEDAVVKLEALEGYGPTSFQNKVNIRLASCFSAMGMNSTACEKILSVVGALPKKPATNSLLGNLFTQGTLSSSSERHLYFINYERQEILQFCVRLVLNCFKDSVLHSGEQDDLILGHLLVLLQYEWPATEPIFLQVIDKIKMQGSFTYNLFFNYIINIDMLEEFAHLATKLGGGTVNLDLLPISASQATKQRTVTRGVNKGAKEDFLSSI